MVNAGAFRDVSGRPLLADWGLELFGSSSTGDDAQSYFFDGR
jgi:hypothetical protein